MTRQEEIIYAALDCAKKYGVVDNSICFKAFKKGAEWADQFLLSKVKEINISCKSRLYNIWHGMKQRCDNPKATGYKLYGGKGIKVCAEWHNNYISFVIWSLLNGYSECLSIDRINVNEGYTPDNCRWATPIQQNNNTSRNVYFDDKTIAMYAKISGINYRTLYNRVTRGGMTIEDAISCSMHNPKRVAMVDDNGNIIREFSSAMAAGILLGGGSSARSHIQDVCRGTRKKALGYKFKYI